VSPKVIAGHWRVALKRVFVCPDRAVAAKC
jgi:hypothetical protein